MLKIIGTNIVIRSFFTKTMHRGQGNAPVSVPQRWFRKLLGILKIWLLGGIFEPKLSMFSKNYFLRPQSTYFVIGPIINHFILDYFQEKVMTTFLKDSKKPFFWWACKTFYWQFTFPVLEIQRTERVFFWQRNFTFCPKYVLELE